jgi:hypothetical protein
MHAALQALRDTDDDAVEDAVPAVIAPGALVDSDSNDGAAGASGGWGSGGNDAALLALRGHRLNQRGTKVLQRARASKGTREDKTHRGYVAEVANRRSSRPIELVKFSGRRIKSIRGSHKRWHERGLLNVCFNPLSKKKRRRRPQHC